MQSYVLLGDGEVGSGCHGDWKRVQVVAHIISSCPSQASSLSHYYSTIAPQVIYRCSTSNEAFKVCVFLQLLALLTSPIAASVQVAAATISLTIKRQPALARTHLLEPLTRPLKLVTVGM